MANAKQFPFLLDAKESISILDVSRFECPDGHRMISLQNQGKKSVRCIAPGCAKLAKKISIQTKKRGL